MSRAARFLYVGIALVGALCVPHSPAPAADRPVSISPPDVGLLCLTERPVILEGEHAPLSAWVSTPDGQPIPQSSQWHWQADAGRIDGPGAQTDWDLSNVQLEPGANVRVVTAKVTAHSPSGSLAACEVRVFIRNGPRSSGGKNSRGDEPDHGFTTRISASHFLLPGETPPAGLGLYSYLLFSAPPKDAEEAARYLKTLEASLQVMQDVEEYLRLHVRLKDLNELFIPVKKNRGPAATGAAGARAALESYDYATAQVLLSRLRRPHPAGPYLVSALQPLSESVESAYLWEDVSGVAPEQAWDRVRFFAFLAAQERSWSETVLRRFTLKVRNLIAVGGKVTPTGIKAVHTVVLFESKP